MGDKYSDKHKRKKPKLTKEQIRQRKIKQSKEADKHGKAKKD